VKADPEAQRRLLEVQAIDTALARLEHKLRTLPETAELEGMARELAGLEDERVRAQMAVDDVARDVSRMEKDVEQVRSRADRDRARLDAGTGPARELEALQQELAQRALDVVAERLTERRQTRAELEQRHATLVRGIDADRAFRRQGRVPLVADLPADLMELYEKIRASTGMGAALLRAGRCEGCRLELSGSERSRVRATDADEVVRCEECRRILVRTAESGL
jgi:predicted  nucleic acid-binding Zn-ribbon protein